MISLGTVPAGSTVYIPFATYAAATGASATCTGLAVTDIEIYKNGSTTQRASDAGLALLDTDGIDFDGITGLHGFSIDLSDNTDAGFYAVGSWYWVVVSAITVDSQTVTFLAAVFRIGPAENTAGYPVVDTGKIGGTTQTARDIGASVLLSSGTGTGQVTLTSGRVNADLTHIATAAVSTSTAQLGVNLVNIAGSAVSTSTAQLGVNVVNAAGTAWGSGAITAASVATGAITNAKFAAGAIDAAAIANNAIDAATFAADVDAEAAAWIWNAATASYGTAGTYGALLESGNVGGGAIVAASVTGAVGSVTGNVGGNVTGSVGSVVGAVGSVTGNVGGNVTGSVGSVAGAVGSVTAGVTVTTNNDKTGYSLATAPPTAAQVSTQVASDLASAHGAGSWATATGFSTHSAADVVTALGTGSTLTALAPASTALSTAVWTNTKAGYIDAAISTAGGGGLTAADIADAVWNETDTGHLDAGKAGAQLWTVINSLSSGAAINITSTNTVIESE